MSGITGEEWHDEVFVSQTESEYTPCTTIPDLDTPKSQDHDSNGHILLPGRSYMIQSVATGKVITFSKGKIVLAPIAGYPSTRWECVEDGGWLGFRDPASNMFLGYDGTSEDIVCQVIWHDFCVRFQAREVDERVYHLLMAKPDYTLRSMEILENDGEERLKMTDSRSKATTWRFIRV